MAVYSFLEKYDFGVKTIISFITHGGSGVCYTVDTISQLQMELLEICSDTYNQEKEHWS